MADKPWGAPYWQVIFEVLTFFEEIWKKEKDEERREYIFERCMEHIGIIVDCLPCMECMNHTVAAMKRDGVYTNASNPSHLIRFFESLKREIAERQ